MRKFAVVVALFAMSAPANAVFFTYSQWEALAPIERASYISGLYDGLDHRFLGLTHIRRLF